MSSRFRKASNLRRFPGVRDRQRVDAPPTQPEPVEPPSIHALEDSMRAAQEYETAYKKVVLETGKFLRLACIDAWDERFADSYATVVNTFFAAARTFEYYNGVYAPVAMRKIFLSWIEQQESAWTNWLAQPGNKDAMLAFMDIFNGGDISEQFSEAIASGLESLLP